jgi:hypothetical protein
MVALLFQEDKGVYNKKKIKNKNKNKNKKKQKGEERMPTVVEFLAVQWRRARSNDVIHQLDTEHKCF